MQLRKHVRVRTTVTRASIVLEHYATTSHMFALCEMCLHDSLVTPTAEGRDRQDDSGSIISVYILGHYQHQRPPDLERWQTHFPQLDIQYQTVHAAKGLEADIVIVL